jgi:hypothetical protein
MSQTSSGAATHRAAPRTEKTRATGAAAPPEQTGWMGWILFAATMMLMLGSFHAIQGLVALFRDEYYLVGRSGLTLHVDYTTWGWVHLVLGLVVAAAGVGLLVAQTWARVVGVLAALCSAVVNLAFMAAYPFWSVMVITVDVLVIWAITVHGREMAANRG